MTSDVVKRIVRACLPCLPQGNQSVVWLTGYQLIHVAVDRLGLSHKGNQQNDNPYLGVCTRTMPTRSLIVLVNKRDCT